MSGMWEYLVSFLIASAGAATLVAQVPSSLPPNVASPSIPTTQQLPSKQFKVKVTVSDIKDLKVRENDSVSVGQVLADRSTERARLETNKRDLANSLKQLESQKIIEPPKPLKVPEVSRLPDISYAEELAAINSAKLRLDQAQQEYAKQVAMLNSEPAGEAAEVEKAKVKLNQQAKLIDIQEIKIEQIKSLQNLPSSVTEHETRVLEEMRSQLAQLESELRLMEGKLQDSASARREKLAQLQIEVEQARAGVSLSESKLDTAKQRRQYQEYEHSINLARRLEEENQSNQVYATQLQRVNEARSQKEFQLSQIKSKIGDVDNQLAELSVIKSPVSGVIRRVKNLGQNDRSIQFELSIIQNNGSATNSDNSLHKNRESDNFISKPKPAAGNRR